MKEQTMGPDRLKSTESTVEQEHERVYELPFEHSLDGIMGKLVQSVSGGGLEKQVAVLQQCAAEAQLYESAISNALDSIKQETGYAKKFTSVKEQRDIIQSDSSLSDAEKQNKIQQLIDAWDMEQEPPAMKIHDLRNSLTSVIAGNLSIYTEGMKEYNIDEYPELDTLEKQLYVVFHTDESEISEEAIQAVSRADVEQLVKQTIVRLIKEIEQLITKRKKEPFLEVDQMSDEDYAYVIRVLNEEFAILLKEQLEKEGEMVYELPFEQSMHVMVQKLKQAADQDLQAQAAALHECGAMAMLYDKAISEALKRISVETGYKRQVADKRRAVENDPSLSDEIKANKLFELQFSLDAPPAMNIHDLRNTLSPIISKVLSYSGRIARFTSGEYKGLDTFEKQMQQALRDNSEQTITISQLAWQIEYSINKLKKLPFGHADEMSDEDYVYAIRVLNEEFEKANKEQKSE